MGLCRLASTASRIVQRRVRVWQTLRAVKRGHFKVFTKEPLWLVIEVSIRRNDEDSVRALWGRQALIELRHRMSVMGDWIANPTSPEVVAQIVDGMA